jgi:hypothetical protein
MVPDNRGKGSLDPGCFNFCDIIWLSGEILINSGWSDSINVTDPDISEDSGRMPTARARNLIRVSAENYDGNL